MTTYNFVKKTEPTQLENEIKASAIVIAVDHISGSETSTDVTFKASLSPEEEVILDAIITAHVISAIESTPTMIATKKNTLEGNPIFTAEKSFLGKSASMTTPDFTTRTTWYYDAEAVADEIMTTSDNLLYDQSRDYSSLHREWINWTRVTERASYTNQKLVVKKNDIIITSGFTVNYELGQITFAEENDPGDVIKVSYYYPRSSRFDLVIDSPGVLLVDYIEVQFSEGCTFPEGSYMSFQPIYNGPAIPAFGIPANTDVVLKDYRYYDADDYLNSSTGGMSIPKFGRLTKPIIILPWNYLTGKTIKPVGDATTNIVKGEFNKLRIELISPSGEIITNGEIATATFYYRLA